MTTTSNPLPKIGVIDATGPRGSVLFTHGQCRPYGLVEHPSYDSLAAVAQCRGLDQIWFTPRGQAARGVQPAFTDWSKQQMGPARAARAASWQTRRFDAHRVEISVPSLAEDPSPWADAALTGAELLSGLEQLAAALGQAWLKSAVVTGIELLSQQVGRYGGLQAPRQLPPPALEGTGDTALFFDRALTAAELGCRYVHCFDKHASYLGVCSSLELGIGEPQQVAWDREEPRPKLPGYWLVAAPTPDRDEAPSVFGLTTRSAFEPSWTNTPTLDLADELGIGYQVLDCWLWPRHARLLRPFHDACAEALQRLRTARSDPDGSSLHRPGKNGLAAHRGADLAIRAVKAVYAATLGGALASTSAAAMEPRPWWYRPDWRHLVVSKARANMLRNLARFAERGCRPIYVLNDAIYVASDEPRPELVADGYHIPLGDSPSEWSCKGSYQLGDVVERGHLVPRLMWAVDRERAASR